MLPRPPAIGFSLLLAEVLRVEVRPLVVEVLRSVRLPALAPQTPESLAARPAIEDAPCVADLAAEALGADVRVVGAEEPADVLVEGRVDRPDLELRDPVAEPRVQLLQRRDEPLVVRRVAGVAALAFLILPCSHVRVKSHSFFFFNRSFPLSDGPSRN